MIVTADEGNKLIPACTSQSCRCLLAPIGTFSLGGSHSKVDLL
jgi:hypothetical protein